MQYLHFASLTTLIFGTIFFLKNWSTKRNPPWVPPSRNPQKFHAHEHFMLYSSPSFNGLRGRVVLSASWIAVLLENPPPWHTTIFTK